ncbi:MAG: metal ABC transporter substrate-binding protein, partial [Ruminococcus sp.]|nr:metal ABC transporter substrate-binding protein [Ruminococcus sp.]
IDELKSLDSDFHELFENNSQTLIFGDRFPFRYFVEDYNLDYYAAFTGCSADTDASFETITFLANKADELNTDTIFAIENSDCTVADAVIENTKSKSQSIAVLDSAQSVTNQQIDSGVTYLSIMRKNYDVLQEVFQ